MNANSISGDMINFRLRALGATSIREINSIMHIGALPAGKRI